MEPQPGQHQLGPHVVNQRVVIRYLLEGRTGPTGGPAMTDVLGVCESWQDGVADVRRADGALVRIPTSLIVSGKPVPPRPSVRMRTEPAVAERLTIDVFDPITEPLGEWIMRVQRNTRPRLFRRANSVLAFGDPGVPLPQALEQTQAFYAEHNRTPLIQVERDGEWERPILDLGWSDAGGNEMWVVGISQALRKISSGQRVDLTADGDAAVAWKKDQAEGRALVSGDWLCIHDVFVEPEHRGHYLGTAVVSELLEWGAEKGARTAWMHVDSNNVAAIHLYDSIGFMPHHASRYLKPSD
jgi:GNAT superfamily N-acetyltransferase